MSEWLVLYPILSVLAPPPFPPPFQGEIGLFNVTCVWFLGSLVLTFRMNMITTKEPWKVPDCCQM